MEGNPLWVSIRGPVRIRYQGGAAGQKQRKAQAKKSSEKQQIDKSIADATDISRPSTTPQPQPGFERSPKRGTHYHRNSIHLITPPEQTPHLSPHLCHSIMYGDLGLKLVCLHNLPFSSPITPCFLLPHNSETATQITLSQANLNRFARSNMQNARNPSLNSHPIRATSYAA